MPLISPLMPVPHQLQVLLNLNAIHKKDNITLTMTFYLSIRAALFYSYPDRTSIF